MTVVPLYAGEELYLHTVYHNHAHINSDYTMIYMENSSSVLARFDSAIPYCQEGYSNSITIRLKITVSIQASWSKDWCNNIPLISSRYTFNHGKITAAVNEITRFANYCRFSMISLPWYANGPMYWWSLFRHVIEDHQHLKSNPV